MRAKKARSELTSTRFCRAIRNSASSILQTSLAIHRSESTKLCGKRFERSPLMKHTMTVVAVIAIVFGVSSGQPTARQAKIERELMQMEHDWSAAYLSHDVSVVDRILADDFIGTDGRGIMTDKKQEMEDARSENPNRKVLSEAIDDMKVRIYG